MIQPESPPDENLTLEGRKSECCRDQPDQSGDACPVGWTVSFNFAFFLKKNRPTVVGETSISLFLLPSPIPFVDAKIPGAAHFPVPSTEGGREGGQEGGRTEGKEGGGEGGRETGNNEGDITIKTHVSPNLRVKQHGKPYQPLPPSLPPSLPPFLLPSPPSFPSLPSSLLPPTLHFHLSPPLSLLELHQFLFVVGELGVQIFKLLEPFH